MIERARQRSDVTAGGDMSIKRLAGRNLLFIEAQQRIFELDDFSAYVWRAASRGLSQTLIVREMISEGIDRSLAEDVVSACLNRLNRLLSP